MGKINEAALLNTLNKYLNSSKGKKVVGAASSGGSLKNAEAAGKEFVEVLREEIADNPMLSTNVKAALDSVSYHTPRKNSEGKYEVEIYFTNDLSRPSLRPSSLYDNHTYEPIKSLAKLYNNGVDHTMNRIWGTWNGEEGVGSRTDIPASNFVKAAISKFNSNYALKYGVTEIIIDNDYDV